jgi:hypothetical protein
MGKVVSTTHAQLQYPMLTRTEPVPQSPAPITGLLGVFFRRADHRPQISQVIIKAV